MIIHDLKVEELKRIGIGKEIYPNYEVMIHDYGDLPNHARNCSTYPGNFGIMITCEDGWVSIGSIEDFKKASASVNYDTSEWLWDVQFAKEYQNFSIIVDTKTNDFYVFEHINARGYI